MPGPYSSVWVLIAILLLSISMVNNVSWNSTSFILRWKILHLVFLRQFYYSMKTSDSISVKILDVVVHQISYIASFACTVRQNNQRLFLAHWTRKGSHKSYCNPDYPICTMLKVFGHILSLESNELPVHKLLKTIYECSSGV